MTDHAQLAIDHVSSVLDLPEVASSTGYSAGAQEATLYDSAGGKWEMSWPTRVAASRAASLALEVVRQFDINAQRIHHPGPLSAPRTESTATALAGMGTLASPPSTAVAPSTDYESARAYLAPEYAHRGVVFPESFVVVAGEYASDGEPDLFLEVGHAVDREGVEVSDHVAAVLARYIASAEFAAAVDESRRTLRRADVTPATLTRAAAVVAEVPDEEG